MTTNQPALLRSDRDGVTTLTLNRPQQRNALSRALIAELHEALNRIAGSEAVPWWGDHLTVTVTMGGTVARDGDTPQSLVARAEEAPSFKFNEGGHVLDNRCSVSDCGNPGRLSS